MHTSSAAASALAVSSSPHLAFQRSWCWQASDLRGDLGGNLSVGDGGLGAGRLSGLSGLKANVSVLASDGWALQTGGAGGSKQWLHASRLGASLQLRVPITAPRLVLEFYKHDSLPLGQVWEIASDCF